MDEIRTKGKLEGSRPTVWDYYKRKADEGYIVADVSEDPKTFCLSKCGRQVLEQARYIQKLEADVEKLKTELEELNLHFPRTSKC
jgi:hypothetical protein